VSVFLATVAFRPCFAHQRIRESDRRSEADVSHLHWGGQDFSIFLHRTLLRKKHPVELDNFQKRSTISLQALSSYHSPTRRTSRSRCSPSFF